VRSIHPERQRAAPERLTRTSSSCSQSPVVTITDNGKTFTFAESGAITEFIIERYGERLGVSASSSDPQERAEYLYWLHYAEGSAMGPLMFSLVFTQIGLQAPWVARPIVNLVTGAAMAQFGLPRLKAMFKHVETSLEGKEYFVGDRLTGADGASSRRPPLSRSTKARRLTLEPLPLARSHDVVHRRGPRRDAPRHQPVPEPDALARGHHGAPGVRCRRGEGREEQHGPLRQVEWLALSSLLCTTLDPSISSMCKASAPLVPVLARTMLESRKARSMLLQAHDTLVLHCYTDKSDRTLHRYSGMTRLSFCADAASSRAASVTPRT